VAAPLDQVPGVPAGMTGPLGGVAEAAIHVGDLPGGALVPPGGPPNPPGGTPGPPGGVAGPAHFGSVGNESSVTAGPYRAGRTGDCRFMSL